MFVIVLNGSKFSRVDSFTLLAWLLLLDVFFSGFKTKQNFYCMYCNSILQHLMMVTFILLIIFYRTWEWSTIHITVGRVMGKYR